MRKLAVSGLLRKSALSCRGGDLGIAALSFALRRGRRRVPRRLRARAAARRSARDRSRPPSRRAAIGTGQVKVALDPAAVGARQCRPCRRNRCSNAAELAIAEFNPTEHPAAGQGRRRHPPGAQQAAQQALDEGAEIILGPLFAQSVQAVGRGRAPAQHSGDRVLDRYQRRRARRLSAELPAGVRRHRASSITLSPTASVRSPR